MSKKRRKRKLACAQIHVTKSRLNKAHCIRIQVTSLKGNVTISLAHLATGIFAHSSRRAKKSPGRTSNPSLSSLLQPHRVPVPDPDKWRGLCQERHLSWNPCQTNMQNTMVHCGSPLQRKNLKDVAVLCLKTELSQSLQAGRGISFEMYTRDSELGWGLSFHCTDPEHWNVLPKMMQVLLHFPGRFAVVSNTLHFITADLTMPFTIFFNFLKLSVTGLEHSSI